MKNPLYIIAGPTAVGKGTLVSLLEKKHKDIWVSISATTRKPRTGETHKKHYYFLDKKEFQKKINNQEFLEYANVHGNYYGTLKNLVDKEQSIGKKVILEIDVQGALQIKEKLNSENIVMIFLKPIDEKVLIERLKKRNTEKTEQIVTRMKTAKKEMEQTNQFDFVIINDNLNKALTDLEKIIYN